MNINWDTCYIDPQHLIGISRGDKDRMLKYLLQFEELVPPRIASLNECLKLNDRKMIRQVLHQMSPQIQFFGIPDIVQPIQKLELEYLSMPYGDLKMMVQAIILKLEFALKEVTSIVNSHFN